MASRQCMLAIIPTIVVQSSLFGHFRLMSGCYSEIES